MSNNRVTFIDTTDQLSVLLSEYYAKNPYGDRRYYGVTRALSETMSDDKTQILKEWRERVGDAEADRIVKESQDIGNSLDTIIEEYLIRKPNMTLYADEPGLPLFYKVKRVIDKIKPIGTQIHMYSDKYKIQGYLDCVGYMNDKLTMIDFKNSKRPKDADGVHDYFLQAACYCILIYEMTGIIIKDICIIISVRGDNVPQVFRTTLHEHIKDAKERLNQFRELKSKK